MQNIPKINEKWIKASVLGTIWASFEIIFGSFLHNLKIPFSGNLLTGIGLIVLISVSFIWKEKGLFWRAGLITALMKTISPSAVIFGPMIAIFAESVLLDISIRFFGHSTLGYFVGASLAMSWNLFQRIVNFIIFYGNNIVELYKNLVRMAHKQLNITLDTEWLPIFIVLGIYIILGILSAIFGMKIGKKLLNKSDRTLIKNTTNKKLDKFRNSTKANFNHSFFWLITNILLIVGSLLILNYTHWIIWSLSVITIVTIWTLRYKRALKQLAKPKFWIYFVMITMLIAFVFRKDNSSLTDSLLLGIQVNFRAVIMILGFAVTGTELYNPKIQNFFKRSSLRQLSIALQLSFESFPATLANIPDAKSIIRNPVNLLFQVISQVDHNLIELKNKLQPKIFIITGAIGEGKTSCIQEVIQQLKQEDISFNGIYSEKIFEEDSTIGYNIVDVKNGSGEVFLRLNGNDQFDKIGKYFIYPEGLTKGNNILDLKNINGSKISIIDEIGLLELENKGWAHSLKELIKAKRTHILLTIRDQFVDTFIQEWDIKPSYLFQISESDYKTIGNSIIDIIKNPEVKPRGILN